MSDTVQPDSYLTLHYRIAIVADAGQSGRRSAEDAGDGEKEASETVVVDTFGGTPATLQLGMGQLAPAIEAKLIGLVCGESATFTLGPGDAFGVRSPDLVQK